MRLKNQAPLYFRRGKAITMMAMLFFFIAPSCRPVNTTVKPTSANAKRYELKGTIISFDQQKREVTVAHEPVPDYMPAMTMPFTLDEPEAFKEMEQGSLISATLVVEDDRYFLERPVITKGGSLGGKSGTNATQTVDPVGRTPPEVSFIDQNNQKFTVAKLRPRVVVVTFIYTRCPLPDACILMSNNFAELSRTIEQDSSLADKIQLLSVSFDPEHDTPAVLRDYIASYQKGAGGQKLSNWRLATGAPADIRRFAEFFGLGYNPANDQITHNLVTAVIAPDGKVYKLYTGNQWKNADLLNDLRASLDMK